ncbi:MAG: hypothetical protein KatS3mg096_462 [Candidatus Parcubacteria bacterium]|nr:MAG: hypothetical protein KatS3mg096_462 [Candidatus Parcubacteria bacterium]
MRYFVFQTEETKIKPGDKVRVLVRNYEIKNNKPEFGEKILEEFVLEKFDYYPEVNILVIFSPANFSEQELVKKIGQGEVILQIESNVS